MPTSTPRHPAKAASLIDPQRSQSSGQGCDQSSGQSSDQSSEREGKKPLSLARIIAIIGGTIASTFLIGGLFRPLAWQRYFSGAAYFDEEHYIAMARHGYELGPSAFHPLFSWLMAGFSGLFGESLLPLWLSGRLLAIGLFFAALVLLHRILRQMVSERAATIATLLFGINPFTIFHALAYTESLYCLLGLGLVWGIIRGQQTPSTAFTTSIPGIPGTPGNGISAFALIAICGLLMAWCRPSYFIFVAIVVGFAGIFLIQHFWLTTPAPAHAKAPLAAKAQPTTEAANEERQRFILSLAVATLAIALGTGAFFLYLDYATGSPWSSLAAQENFDRSFGFYWQLFLTPATLNGSDNIFVWELHAFYLPMLLAMAFLSYRPWRETLTGTAFYVFWFATLFTGAHIAANLFTHPRFYSLGRHVLAQPYFFIALAFAIDRLPRRPWLRYLLWFYLFASFAYLCNYWGRFGKGSWIG